MMAIARHAWRLVLCGLLMVLALSPLRAQDGLNLPTELYVLLNEGTLQRYGLGASGVQAIVGDAFVLDFAVAPDGNWLAYRTQESLFLRDMYAELRATPFPDVLIESGTSSYPDSRGKGETIAWSPDSTKLAYTTFGNGRVHFRNTGAFQDLGVAALQDLRWSPNGTYLAVGAADNIWWFFATQGNSVVLVGAVTNITGIAWLPDERMYVTPSTGGVNLLDIALGSAQTPVLDADEQYFLPYVIAPFLYVFRGTTTEATLLSVTVEETLELGTNPVDTTSLRWSPDARSLIAFNGGTMALVDPMTGEGFTLPINGANAYGWGAYNPVNANFTGWGASYMLADALSSGVTQVWRVPDDGTLPETITPAKESITEFTVSADGSKVAYVSAGALYYYTVGGSVSDDLFDLVTPTTEQVTPAFSADGTRLYYHDSVEGTIGIYYADLTNGETYPFLVSAETTYLEAIPSDSVSAVLAIDSEGRTHVVNSTTGEPLFEAIQGRGQWLGGSLLLITSDIGLTVIDINQPDSVLQTIPLDSNDTLLDVALRPDNQTIRLLVRSAAPAPVRVVDVQGGQVITSVIAGYLDEPRLSPDTNYILGLSHPNGDLVIANLRVAQPEIRIIQVGVAVKEFEW